MRQGVGLVFDETLFGKGSFYTSSALNGLLAVQDQMAFQVIVDNVHLSLGAGAAVSVWLETSGDGRSWVTKNPSAEVAPFAILENRTNVSPYSADLGVLPTLSFARLRITLADAEVDQTISAHVKIFVTFRDLGGEVITSLQKPSVAPPVAHPAAPNPKSASAEISASLNLVDTTLLPWGYDDGQRPSYAYVRLRIEIICAGYPGSAHLVIHATGRDSGGVTVRTAAKSVYNFIPPPRVPRAPPDTPEEIEKRCMKLGLRMRECVEAAKL